MKERVSYRVGVLFGGRSSEHEVSLASAKNVMEALRQAGHEVVPIGITREGRWLPQPDAWLQLTAGSPHSEQGETVTAYRTASLAPSAWPLSEQCG